MPQALDPYSPEAYARAVKPFHAVIEPAGGVASDPARRVTLYAKTREEAERLLQAEYPRATIVRFWLDQAWDPLSSMPR